MTGNSTNENNAMKSGIPSLNLPADAGLPASGTTPAAGLQAVLDNLDALVYVSDFQTHELLYMNAYGRLVRLEIATDISPGASRWNWNFRRLTSKPGPQPWKTS